MMMNIILTFLLGLLVEHILSKSTKKVLAHLLNCLSVIIMVFAFFEDYGTVLNLFWLYVKYVYVLFDVNPIKVIK